MPTTTRSARIALALSAALLPFAAAHALSPAEQPYVGGYTSGSVDTRTQIMLLDDNTFCFTFMGGSLDMLVGGRWAALPGKDAGVRLRQVRRAQTAFPAFGKQVPGQDGKVVFDFHGYSLSNAALPAFAVSADDSVPATFRPLFAEGRNSWAESYLLPPMDLGAARYFFIAHSDADRQGRPVGKLKVTQYRLVDANNVLIGFDQQQANPPLDMTAQLKSGVLHVDGERFGKRDALPAEVVVEIREACVAPALAGGPSADRDRALVPVKTFEVEPAAVRGAPYFDKN